MFRRTTDKRARLKIAKVLRLLRNSKLASDDASCNYIADFAYNKDIELSSDMIVYVHNKYYRYCTCLCCTD